jgi:hypothetical protein
VAWRGWELQCVVDHARVANGIQLVVGIHGAVGGWFIVPSATSRKMFHFEARILDFSSLD